MTHLIISRLKFFISPGDTWTQCLAANTYRPWMSWSAVLGRHSLAHWRTSSPMSKQLCMGFKPSCVHTLYARNYFYYIKTSSGHYTDIWHSFQTQDSRTPQCIYQYPLVEPLMRDCFVEVGDFKAEWSMFDPPPRRPVLPLAAESPVPMMSPTQA